MNRLQHLVLELPALKVGLPLVREADRSVPGLDQKLRCLELQFIGLVFALNRTRALRAFPSIDLGLVDELVDGHDVASLVHEALGRIQHLGEAGKALGDVIRVGDEVFDAVRRKTCGFDGRGDCLEVVHERSFRKTTFTMAGLGPTGTGILSQHEKAVPRNGSPYVQPLP